MMRNLLIVEPHSSGHRFGYVYWIARDALIQGVNVTVVTTPECVDRPELQKLYSYQSTAKFSVVATSLDAGFAVFNIPGLNKIFREFRYWAFMRRAHRAGQQTSPADLVFVPYLDYCVNAVSLLGSPFGLSNWSGIVMRQAFQYQKQGIIVDKSRFLSLKETLFSTLLRIKSLKTIFTIDEPLYEYISAHSRGNAAAIKLLKDPVEFSRNFITRAELRKQYCIPNDACLILVYGTIDIRKGLDYLLKGLALRGVQPTIHVLIAGRFQVGMGEVLAEQEASLMRDAGTLHVMDKYLTKEEEAAVFDMADMVWLGYRQHFGMSGVMVQAGIKSLPIVSCREGIIGWSTVRKRCGIAVDVTDPIAVSEAVLRLANDKEYASQLGRNGKLQFVEHTADEFSKTILSTMN